MGRDPLGSCLTSILRLPFLVLASIIRQTVNAFVNAIFRRRRPRRRRCAPPAANEIIKEKSYAVALTLTILFGPFGLLYVSLGPTIFFVLAGEIASLFVPLYPLLLAIWVMPILCSPFAVSKHNKRLRVLRQGAKRNRQIAGEGITTATPVRVRRHR
jgi:hypothetical protein